ncbi:MAG TPA: hypothetical protein VHZ09_14110 [Acidobacteriaceae bacterium]|jgi:hypothetical protein|nr:hypothetical protein [Acidobacteriaceae bacterium]
MRNARFGLGAYCLFVVAVAGCQTPSQDWNGTWKLDTGKSSYQGQVLTISLSPDGEFRFDENSSHILRCDGKERPIGNNRTQACVMSGATVLKITVKHDGAKTVTTRDELSDEGRIFTTTRTEYQSNGSPTESQLVFSRLSGSTGFAGKWRDTSYLQQHAEMVLRLDHRTLHIDYPSVGQHIDAPLDGVDVPIQGPRTLPGSTYAVRLAGQRELTTTARRNGKIFTQGSLELSRDGKIISDSWWEPDRPDIKGTLLYEKQGDR